MKKRMCVVAAGLAAAAIPATAAVGAPARTAASLPTASFKIDGSTMTGPKTVPAGAVSFSVTVAGKKPADFGLVKLNPGVTVAKAFGLVQAAHGDPNALIGYATVVGDAPALPGSSTPYATELTPGNYAALNFASNARPVVSTFTVRATGHRAALPAAPTVKEIEFGFEGPSTWHVGETVRFENAGYVTHMVIGLPFPTKAAAKKAMSLLMAGKDQAAGKGAVGAPVEFVGTNGPTGMQQQTITAKPGIYVIACFMATGDHREHTRLGMVKMVTITK